MMRKVLKVLAANLWAVSLLVLPCAIEAGCTTSGRQYMAADNGQPRMQAALRALAQAKAETESASPAYGSYREQAIDLIQRAFDAANAGMRHATAHATELSDAEGPASAELVDQTVLGAERQPQMARAVVALRQAHLQLRQGKTNKGGYRQQAIKYIHLAMEQLREGIQFVNTYDPNPSALQ